MTSFYPRTSALKHGLEQTAFITANQSIQGKAPICSSEQGRKTLKASNRDALSGVDPAPSAYTLPLGMMEFASVTNLEVFPR